MLFRTGVRKIGQEGFLENGPGQTDEGTDGQTDRHFTMALAVLTMSAELKIVKNMKITWKLGVYDSNST